MSSYAEPIALNSVIMLKVSPKQLSFAIITYSCEPLNKIEPPDHVAGRLERRRLLNELVQAPHLLQSFTLVF